MKKRLNKRGRVFITSIILIFFVIVISVLPNAEPQKMDGDNYYWNEEVGMYYGK